MCFLEEANHLLSCLFLHLSAMSDGSSQTLIVSLVWVLNFNVDASIRTGRRFGVSHQLPFRSKEKVRLSLGLSVFNRCAEANGFALGNRLLHGRRNLRNRTSAGIVYGRHLELRTLPSLRNAHWRYIQIIAYLCSWAKVL